MGVTTITESWFGEWGSGTRHDTKGYEAFREKYTFEKDGYLYDRATGKNASIAQSGGKFDYFVW